MVSTVRDSRGYSWTWVNARWEPIAAFLSWRTIREVQSRRTIIWSGQWGEIKRKGVGESVLNPSPPFSLPPPLSDTRSVSPAGPLPFLDMFAFSLFSLLALTATHVHAHVCQFPGFLFLVDWIFITFYSDPSSEHVWFQRHRSDLLVRQPARGSVDRLHF